jgi:phosphoglycerate dehydrogenase-like enzyme
VTSVTSVTGVTGVTGRVVLICRDRFTAEQDWTDLRPLLPDWTIRTCGSGDVIEHLAGVDVVCPVGAVIDRAVLDAGRFGLVQQFGVGLDKVDLERAAALGVWAARIPGEESGNAASVAELAVLFLLALVRRLDDARAAFADWDARPTGGSLLGSTVAIVGLGAIGSALAVRLTPFCGKITGIRARPARGGAPGVAEVAGPGDLHKIVAEADAVVCCAMYDGSNANLFDAAAFAAMKPGAIFVNVARGGLVDETALLAALNSGQVGGAGLDVYATEPADPGSLLLRHPRVIATPHVGGLTYEMFRRTATLFAGNLNRWAAGEPPRWAANSPTATRQHSPS